MELRCKTIYEKFNEWCFNNGVKYETNSLKLAVRISRLNIDGISKIKNNKFNITRFDFPILKKKYCLDNSSV